MHLLNKVFVLFFSAHTKGVHQGVIVNFNSLNTKMMSIILLVVVSYVITLWVINSQASNMQR